MTITLIIIIITVLVSISAFSSERIMNDLIFYPPAVTQNRQWYRFFTCGFIHADYGHLVFNMYALYLFGQGTQSFPGVETKFGEMFGANGKFLYLLMYLTALLVCLLPTYSKNRNNASYRSLGASGAVSAVIFAAIIINPLQGLMFLFIPYPIPGFIFGFIYLVVSSFLDRRGGGNINHSAHIWGALYGIAFIIAAGYLAGFPILDSFVQQIQLWYGRNFK